MLRLHSKPNSAERNIASVAVELDVGDVGDVVSLLSPDKDS